MPGAVGMGLATLLMGGIVLYLLAVMVRNIAQGKQEAKGSVWKNYGLSIALCVLFFGSWLGQGIVQWQEFTDSQREHNQPVTAGDFFAEFSRSTFENWQSEFLQLFSFVVLSAVLIHRDSAESKDSDERMEAALARIEKRLDEMESSRQGS
jgi:NADH:ubiquinone oxidoreductase subunit 6 (subunit J)